MLQLQGLQRGPCHLGADDTKQGCARFSTLLAVRSNTTGTVYAPESHASLNTSEGLFARKSLNL